MNVPQSISRFNVSSTVSCVAITPVVLLSPCDVATYNLSTLCTHNLPMLFQTSSLISFPTTIYSLRFVPHLYQPFFLQPFATFIKMVTRVQVRDRFPSVHIQGFGFGTVGLVYVTFDHFGKIALAEAELYDASYKSMVIDDPKILRIFGDQGEKIDMDLLYPWAQFRLDPAIWSSDFDGASQDPGGNQLGVQNKSRRLSDIDDDELFAVGRLMDITHLPAIARFGLRGIDASKQSGGRKVFQNSFGTMENIAEAARPAGRDRSPKASALQISSREVQSEATTGGYGLRRCPKPSARLISASRMQKVSPTSNYSNRTLKRAGAATRRNAHTAQSELDMSPTNPMTENEDLARTNNGNAQSHQAAEDWNASSTEMQDVQTVDHARPMSWTPVPLPLAPRNRQQDRTPGRTLSPNKARLVPKGPMAQKIQGLVDEMLAVLPDMAAQDQYIHYVTVVRREVARDLAAKHEFHNELENFVKQHNITKLHNMYALWTKGGSNKPYHMPTFTVDEMTGVSRAH